MKNNFKLLIATTLIVCTAILSGCQKGDLLSNPNVVSESATVPASLILNQITSNLLQEEEPIVSSVYRYNQHIVSNYSYYFGSNAYNWSNTSDPYSRIKFCVKLEEQAQKQFGNTTNVYFALSKFFKAYSFIWLTQRVGDIPMTQAGDPNNLTPAYDAQKTVYKNCLALLDTASALMSNLYSPATAGNKVDATGDIYGLSFLQWHKVINSFKLRVLISLSKIAVDNADLNIPAQFAAIVTNPAKYPIMTSNGDNLAYKYTAITLYPPNRTGNAPYNNCANINQTFMNLLTQNRDPRTFVLTTPALYYIKRGKQLSDFTAYVGQDNNKTQAQMTNFNADSLYSCMSYNRYMSSPSGANCEPYILLGYPELCFNIAEAANRGWLPGVSGAAWYAAGINASLSLYGITDGKSVTIGNYDGTNTNLGSVTLDVATFLTNVAYAGDNAAGLTQILNQKFLAFWMNSGYESFYQWRRTGVPAFGQGGVGVGTPGNTIPLRWQYPLSEINYNSSNYQTAIQSQYGGVDDLNAKMWLIK